jgi:hypothetical protein
MTAGLASTIGRLNLTWVRLEIAFLVGALMMGA